jgi:prevent-host-death family protein
MATNLNIDPQLLDEAIREGPQIITRRGVEEAVLLSYAEYRKMIASEKKPSAFFRESPLVGVHLYPDRDTIDLREDITL